VVLDPSGALITRGSVWLVPAEDVAQLAEEPIDLTLSPIDTAALAIDEPLEDLIDAHGDDYARAAIDSGGRYALRELPSGRFFVVFTPSDDDPAHLPGGSACRSAVDAASLIGTRLDLRVSSAPSEGARHVGSSACLNCHGRHRTMATPHRIGLQVPGQRGPYQDISRYPDIDDGLAAFQAGTTLYFYDCDPERAGEAKCKVQGTDPTLEEPTAMTSFELSLAHDPSRDGDEAYTMTLHNALGGGDESYAVALTYGGALFKQHYITQRPLSSGGRGHFVLPLQWNTQGSDAFASFEDWTFRDYRSDLWYDFDDETLREPAPADGFDTQCAGCHLTGMQLRGDAASGFSAHAVPDVAGDYDYDGDGRAEEINVGCESCHGPGSEHVEARTRGLAIVSPSLLTPERETALCGRCHARPLGALADHPMAPLDEDGALPPPGLRRAQLARFTSRVDGAPEDFHASGDSAAHHAQYSDFIRSTMYRNGSILMTCSSCHDAHGSDQHEHSLRRAADDNAACTGCHAEDEYTAVRTHVRAVTSFEHDATAEASFTCTSCHMVRTVASGARRPELRDNIPASPVVQYFHGDIASHRFTVTPLDRYDEQPVAGTLQCAFCHGEQLPNP
jgi:predicted CXXCH cytochrome family protein